MTIKNKEVFAKDPTETKIPNDGFAQVVRPDTDEQWEVLEWELRNFVCEGEFERGLERILNSYLTNLGQSQQPAVWVSGFYGSGKSHLCRVLEYLWRDVELPSGETARSLVNLPPEINAHFVELSNAGKRLGGLWSAAGTMGAGRSQAVRLAFLSILFESAELPQQYPLARFTIWAQEEGLLENVRAAVNEAGKEFEDEVQNLYVSPIIAQALLEAEPTLGDSVKDVRQLLQTQFPPRAEDITDDEMFDTIEDVLRLQTDTEGRYPLTLVVLDEMQQYLGDDNEKTLAVQNIVEGVSSRFDNCVLFLATGQSAMGGTPTLQKLTDRFPVHVHLSDKDVETVVRQVVLRKKPDQVGELEEVLDDVSGEIDRHLAGTRIGSVAADKKDLVPDYPILPARRRFWELALRALDRAGKSGVIRTQLRIIHEATREVAQDPLGHVVGADFLYEQQAANLQQSGVLLKEISESILALRDEGDSGELKSRICALVFLINSIPEQLTGAGETGLRATAHFIADLLVEDLYEDGARMRKRVPELLEELTESGRLMRIDDEYRLQTEEGAEWEKEYHSRRSAIRDNASKLATLRSERLYNSARDVLDGISLTQGRSRTPRKIELYFGPDEPVADGRAVPVWIRDEWSVTEATIRSAAAQAGDEDPVVHVLLPKRDPESIKDALASYAAAQETAQAKPTPQTDEGREAQQSMKGRIEMEGERLSRLFQEVVAEAKVYQGGGNEVTGSSLRGAVELAAERSLVRMFPKFDVADDPNWGRVVSKARDGAPDALEAVGFSGDARAHPVCKEVLATISAAGTEGNEVRTRFAGRPYGWEEDAIRGALLVLLATQHIRAEQNGVPLSGPRELEPRQIGKTTFYKEDEPPTVQQRLAVGGLLTEAGIDYQKAQEQEKISALLQRLIDLAENAGGEPPLPEIPDVSHIEALQELGGNQQFRTVADQHEQLTINLEQWRKAVQRREERLKEWDTLQAFLRHGQELETAVEVGKQRDAIRDQRQLLDEPDPIRPLIDQIAAPLRKSLQEAVERLSKEHEAVMEELRASDEWQQLDDTDRAEIISKVDLEPPSEIDVSTQEKLQSTLKEMPLRSWQDRIEVVRARATRARTAAAKRLEPEAVRVSLDSATLKSKEDAEAYLAQAHERIMKHIDDGQTVII